jgi:acyl carrier protein phosphodiesterase
MNFLAHLYLTRHSDDAMLGGLLGDFVSSAELVHYPAEVQREIQLHRRIDSYTDRHPAVLAAKSVFPEGRRRYAGILLDVYFDHLLARDWDRYHPVALEEFSRNFYAVLMAQPVLPERLRAILPSFVRHDWLGSYRDRDSIDHAVRRIATRLSRNGDKLVQCIPILREHETIVERRFEEFFPELEAYVARERAGG